MTQVNLSALNTSVQAIRQFIIDDTFSIRNLTIAMVMNATDDDFQEAEVYGRHKSLVGIRTRNLVELEFADRLDSLVCAGEIPFILDHCDAEGMLTFKTTDTDNGHSTIDAPVIASIISDIERFAAYDLGIELYGYVGDPLCFDDDGHTICENMKALKSHLYNVAKELKTLVTLAVGSGTARKYCLSLTPQPAPMPAFLRSHKAA